MNCVLHEREMIIYHTYCCEDCGAAVCTVELALEDYDTLKRKALNFELLISDRSRQKAREIIERNNAVM